MSNRVLAAIERRRDQIARGVKPDGSPITGDLAATERALANSVSDHVLYQETQAWAHVSGILTTDEAMTVYAALGEAPGPSGWSAGADLATKAVVTQIIGELVDRRLR